MPKYLDNDGVSTLKELVQPTDEQVTTAVSAVLAAHPEWTTTVQDGSITGPKIADNTIPDAKLAQTGGVLSKTNALYDEYGSYTLSDATVHRVKTSSTVESAEGVRLRIVIPVKAGQRFYAACTLGSGVAVSVYQTENDAIYAGGGSTRLQTWNNAAFTTNPLSDNIAYDGFLTVSEKNSDGSAISDADKAALLAATTYWVKGTEKILLENVRDDAYTKSLTLANGTIVNQANARAVHGETFVRVRPGNTVTVTTDKPVSASGNYYVYGFQTYDANKAVVRSVDHDSSKTSNTFDIADGECYFRVVLAEYDSQRQPVTLRVESFTGYDVQASVSYGYPSSRLSQLESLLDGDVNTRNADMDTAVAAAVGYNHFASGNASSSTASKRNLGFAVITDLHGSGDALERFVQYANNHKNYVDAALCLGDSAASNPSSNVSWLPVAIDGSVVPFLYTVGNHDVSDTGSSSISQSTARTRFFSKIEEKEWLGSDDFMGDGKCSWYKDFASYSIRVVSLFEYGNTDTVASSSPGANCRRWLDTDTLQWFADTLYTTPAGYSVIVLLHQVSNNSVTYADSAFTASHGHRTEPPHFLNTVDGNPIEEVVNAFMTSTAISKTYSSIASYELGKTATVSKDFSGRSEDGSFVCYLVGHAHTSYVLRSSTYSDQMTVVVNTGSTSFFQRQYSDVDYDPDTRNADCFYVVGIDTTDKTVNIVQIGGQVTVDMRERRFTAISYA